MSLRIHIWDLLGIREYVINKLKKISSDIKFEGGELEAENRSCSRYIKIFASDFSTEIVKNVYEELTKMGFSIHFNIGDKWNNSYVINKDRIIMKYKDNEWCERCGRYIIVRDDIGWFCVICKKKNNIYRHVKVNYLFTGASYEKLEIMYIHFDDNAMMNVFNLHRKENKVKIDCYCKFYNDDTKQLDINIITDDGKLQLTKKKK